MIVRCISKDPHGKGLEYGHEPVYLEAGKEYKVYGLETVNGNVIVYVSDQDNSFFPSRYLLSYFEIVSQRISKYWKLHFANGDLRLFVEDWIRLPDFMSLYIEGRVLDPEYGTLTSFYEVRNQIDSESEIESQYLDSMKITETLRNFPKVRSFDDSEHDEADAIVTGLVHIRESCEEIFNHRIPNLLWPGQTEEEKENVLWDLGDELKHIQYHLDDMRCFRLQLGKGN